MDVSTPHPRLAPVPLGRSGLLVSPIALGTVKIGRTRGLKYPGADAHTLPDDDQVLALLRSAHTLGVNLLDTAPAYGLSEERLGSILHAQGWFGAREQWVLSTKAGEEFDDTSGLSRFDFSPGAIVASVERSLRRLRTDVLDIVLLHSDGRDFWVIEQSGAMDALRTLKAQGKIRAVGASTKTPDGGLSAVRHAGGSADVVMVEYSQRAQANAVVIDAARPRGVGVLVKKALMSGHLDKLARAAFPGQSTLQTPVQGAIAFALARPGVSGVLVGTTNPAHLLEAVLSVRA